jgi:hypothetical protein
MEAGKGRFSRSGEQLREPLELAGEPVTFAPSSLPGHRMLTLRVRNAGQRPVSLRANELELIDDSGQSLRASAALGRARHASTTGVTVDPGQTVALDLVWRARPGAGIPVRVDYAIGTLDLATQPALAG